MKAGDTVKSKNGWHKGRIKYVYPHSFVDVVWNCPLSDWINYASQKELKSDLINTAK